jgi:hypothetical protein
MNSVDRVGANPSGAKIQNPGHFISYLSFLYSHPPPALPFLFLSLLSK